MTVRPRRRRTVALFGTLAALAALVAAPATTASADIAQPRPTHAALLAGITRPGQARMGWSLQGSAGSPVSSLTSVAASLAVTQTPGIDVSSWQGNVNWPAQWAAGNKFAYVKATEGTGYHNPYFAQQYNGSYTVGMVRGAYHFALPDKSSGAVQADAFVNNGGRWSADGKTLPGVLDIEYNPYGATCYGLSPTAMTTWISDFVNRYRARTGRYPVIYTTLGWWTSCTGNTSKFSTTSPLWIARYASTPGTLPAGYLYYTFWQYSAGTLDHDYFNGSLARLKALALG
jgi:GH25 family lysozyme M1 (1,4-beta-N-acetylmuramidase)